MSPRAAPTSTAPRGDGGPRSLLIPNGSGDTEGILRGLSAAGQAFASTHPAETTAIVLFADDAGTACATGGAALAPIAAEALANGLPTYVISMSAEVAIVTELDVLAAAGGTDRAFDGTAPDAVRFALEAIVADASCR